MRVFIPVFLTLFIFCGNNRTIETKIIAGKLSEKRMSDKYDTLLSGLTKNYVVNVLSVGEDNRQPILKFYNRSELDFNNDSIIYFRSIESFFACDSSIINYLTSFVGDTSICDWIYSPNPYSSKIKNWEIQFTKEQGATVLIYDFLAQSVVDKSAITTSPSEVELILSRYKLQELSEWVRLQKAPLDKIRRHFKDSFELILSH